MDTKPGPKTTINTFGFLDEVGLLHTPQEDRVFGLGLLKLRHPAHLHKEIIRYKNKIRFHDEFKFSNVRDANLKIYKGLLDVYFDTHFTDFSVIIFDKKYLDIKNVFKNNHFKAYNAFCAMLIIKSLDTSEYITVIADDVSTPKADHFEKEVKEKIKGKLRRNALFGICRLESHAISEIQVVDVLLGTIAYSFKIKYGLVKLNRRNAKFKLMQHLQKHLNISLLSTSGEYHLRFGRKFLLKEFQGNLPKKIDSALGETAN